MDDVLIWEAPKIEKPEFRLYYDDQGYVVCYSCEKLEGKYIVIDSLTYIESRPDVRVVDEKIVKLNSGYVISRLYKDEEGTMCHKEDISIITEKNGQHWNLKTNTMNR